MRNGLFLAAAWAVCAAAQPAGPLNGTKLLDWEGDLSIKMMDGAHRFAERKIRESAASREKHWRRDLSSPKAYQESVEPNRRRFREITGVVDQRGVPGMERFADASGPELVAESPAVRVYQVRWPVLDGVYGQGLLLEPKSAPSAYVIALPDADQTPEQIAGLAPGLAPASQYALRLAEHGCLVLAPVLIDRTARWSGRPDIRMTDQPHREWIYRQAFQMGRHIIGYEVQKVLAAVDWLKTRPGGRKIGVAGYGEGGLVAFYSAAIDPRIDAALVSGYFGSREQVWSEPIFRNVWGLLEQFGDAEIAGLIAPRAVTVEYSEAPAFRSSKGNLSTPPYQSVAAEFARIDRLVKPGFQNRALIAGPNGQPVRPGSPEALAKFLASLGASVSASSARLLADRRQSFDPAARQQRQVKELEAHVQRLFAESERVRNSFFLHKVAPQFNVQRWSTLRRHDTDDPGPFVEKTRWYREYFQREAMGRFDEGLLPPNARTRKLYDTSKYTGYEVVLDVWPEVFAWGILLVPKDIKAGERRPVVVCQHGRQGVPKDVVEGDSTAYNQFAARLAERGFVTFAPHNLYRGEDRYRWLSRKANNVKASLFSFIIAQHEQILRWLADQPFVDGSRIAFYGLSYGGETAMRVPAVLEKYAVSICSGDFNQWTRKVAATDERFSFMYTIEWEMPYFNLGSTFDYAEMAYLIFPRPFMVERGHHDMVGQDRWVAYEYAKVKWLYDQLGVGDRTAIEYFGGGHSINGEGTFEFLHRHLRWPVPGAR